MKLITPFIPKLIVFWEGGLAVSHLFTWQGGQCCPCNKTSRWMLQRRCPLCYLQLDNTIICFIIGVPTPHFLRQFHCKAVTFQSITVSALIQISNKF